MKSKVHFTSELVTEHLVGEILKDDLVIGQAIVDVEYDPLDSNSMTARLVEVKFFKDHWGAQFDFDRLLLFRATYGHYEVSFSFEFTSFGLSMTSQILEASILELRKIWRYPSKTQTEPAPDEQCSIVTEFQYPPVKILERSMLPARHSHRGLFYGVSEDRSWLNPIMPEKWQDEILTFEIGGLQVRLFDGLEFFEAKNQVLMRQGVLTAHYTALQVEQPTKYSGLHLAEQRARSIADSVSKAFTFVERNRINWFGEDSRLQSSLGGSMQASVLRWRSPANSHEGYVPAEKYKKVYRRFFPELAQAIYLVRDKTTFNEIHRSYELACVELTYEITFIFFHSCLELLRKALDFRGRSLQKGILSGCLMHNIRLDDLFETSELEGVDKHNRRFRFTEIRDSYLHEGLSMSRFPDAIEISDKMRALVERLIMLYLGYDYLQTPLGRSDYFVTEGDTIYSGN